MMTPLKSEEKEALLYGLNYTQTPRLRLNGCWNDAIGLCSMLTAEPFSFDPSKVNVVIDNSLVNSRRCSKQAIVNAFNALAARSWKNGGLDVAVIAYSGHGSHQRDFNGDEADGQDEGICPTDCMSKGLLIDDQLNNIFSKFNPKTRVYAIFDCCHSGTIVDLPYTFPCVDPIAAASAGFDENTPHITMISGCRDSQTSADAYNRATHKFGGALTMAVLKTLQDAGDGAATLGALDLHARVLALLKTQGHSQFPIISSTRPITNDITMFA